jgi:hypothetical protein
VVSNRERANAKQLGAASAVLYNLGREFKHKEQVFGETITEAETRTRSLSPGLELLADFLSSQAEKDAPIPREAIIIFPHTTAPKKMLDPTPHAEQPIAIGHLNSIGEILRNQYAPNIKLLTLPRNIPFIGFKRAKQLAMEAIRVADLDEIVEPQTIQSQINKTNEETINKWAERWHQNPRTSWVYQTALTKPPDGRPHPTFQYRKAEMRAGSRRPQHNQPPTREAKSSSPVSQYPRSIE